MKVKEGIRMAKRKGGDDSMVSRLKGNETMLTLTMIMTRG